jgi:hypothetical protein
MKSIGKFVIDKLLSYMLLMVQQTRGLLLFYKWEGLSLFSACFITD